MRYKISRNFRTTWRRVSDLLFTLHILTPLKLLCFASPSLGGSNIPNIMAKK